MIYGYIRVSTDKQTVENQRYEILEFCKERQLKIDCWIEETVSGNTRPEQRKLGNYLTKLRKGDILICAEISRLGRNLLMIMSILNNCINKDVQIWTIKEKFHLSNDLNSKVLAFAFGLCAEVEKILISQRTKEALNRKKAEGMTLGRPIGSRSKMILLSGKEKEIKRLKEKNVSISAIAKEMGVHRHTMSNFIKQHNL